MINSVLETGLKHSTKPKQKPVYYEILDLDSTRSVFLFGKMAAVVFVHSRRSRKLKRCCSSSSRQHTQFS